ncbi:MAG: hypothetical protein R3B70_02170 [Polyangiaceae bacterium]
MTARARLVPHVAGALPSPLASAFALVVALSGALALTGCRAEGAPYTCTCDMLTDFDDAHRETVNVCAKAANEAPAVAQGCAQLANPMPVQSCACAPSKEAPPTCREGCVERSPGPDGVQ